jgi:hypothetical protein
MSVAAVEFSACFAVCDHAIDVVVVIASAANTHLNIVHFIIAIYSSSRFRRRYGGLVKLIDVK